VPTSDWDAERRRATVVFVRTRGVLAVLAVIVIVAVAGCRGIPKGPGLMVTSPPPPSSTTTTTSVAPAGAPMQTTVTTTYTVTSINCKPGEVPPVTVHEDITPGQTAIGPNGEIMHWVPVSIGPIDCNGPHSHPTITAPTGPTSALP
jgi:hypothetical protein